MSQTLEHQLQELEVLAQRGDHDAAGSLLAALPEADSAELLHQLEPEFARRIVTSWSPGEQASVFGYLRPALQAFIATGMSRDQLAALFERMDHDERADVYKRLDESQRAAVLPGLAHAEREDIRQLASYPEETVGAMMTSSYVALGPELTVSQALDTVRLEGPDAETLYIGYVLDQNRRLIGVVSLRELLLSDSATRVRDIMTKDVIYAGADAPRAEVARLIARYDLLAVPVVNHEGQMVGVVTHDDALDITVAENTEDQYRLGAVASMSTSLSDATIGVLYRTRVGWLVVLVFGNVFSGAGIAHFEDLIARLVSLVFFLPLLIDSGGNAGSQSATLMVRALATDDVRPRDWFRLLTKELQVALLLGLSMAAAVSLVGYWRGGLMVALVVSITMVLIVVVGSLIGMSLPFLLNRFKLDPATASAPLVTTICDALGVLIYFNVAGLVFGLGA